MNEGRTLGSNARATAGSSGRSAEAPDALTAKLSASSPTLCVSLVRNDLELAMAVEDAGADAIKLHINLDHPYARVRLGSFEEEAESLAAIVSTLKIPVGLVPRGAGGTTVEEIETYAEVGFDFVDLYSSFMSASLLAVPGIRKWAAPRVDYTPPMLEELSNLSGVDVIEAAFLPVQEFGSPLNVDDLVRLRVALNAIGGRKPLVLPTDRQLTEPDLPILLSCGVTNFLIGYAVTGNDLQGVVEATKRFRRPLLNAS
ncbi:MAG: hypothetical protein WD273_05620 [Trueperaceae bacterium]